jgi:hypothetical protein
MARSLPRSAGRMAKRLMMDEPSPPDIAVPDVDERTDGRGMRLSLRRAA